MPQEYSESEKSYLYPVKIVIPPCKSRVLYFKELDLQNKWIESLKSVIGYSNIFDYYNIEGDLGKGQFAVVKLATHKSTGQRVAIKTINKKDMKPVEIY